MDHTKRKRLGLVFKMYWQHDLDLTTLCYYDGFCISYWIKQALIAFVRKKIDFSIPVPDQQPVIIDHNRNKFAHIELYYDTERDVIEFVKSFRKGFRNSGVKLILRSYLHRDMYKVYFDNSSCKMRSIEPGQLSRLEMKKQIESLKERIGNMVPDEKPGYPDPKPAGISSPCTRGRNKKKAGMAIVVKLYWQHDLDLTTLCYYDEFCISAVMKQAVVAFARNDDTFSISVPEERPLVLEHKNKYAHFTLYEEEEPDVIDFVKTFRHGFRNNGLKQILRQYLGTHFINAYLAASSYSMLPANPKPLDVIHKKNRLRKKLDTMEKAFAYAKADESKGENL